MRTPRTLAPIALLAVAACGGPLFDAEVVVDRFCYTTPVTGLPAVPPTVGVPVALPVTIPVQLPPLLRTKGSTVVLRLLDAEIAATSAGTDLSPVVRLDLDLASTGQVLARYDRPATHPTPLRSIAAQGQGVDVAGAVQGGSVQVKFAVTTDGVVSGSTPTSPWDANVTVCFYGRTEIGYF